MPTPSNENEHSPTKPEVSGDTVNRRREFLSGKNLLRWWEDWGRQSLSAPVLPPGPLDASAMRPGLFHHLSKNGMACQWDVLLNHGQYPSGPEFALEALEAIENWEEQLSVFRPHSELSQVNMQAAHQPVPVSDELWSLLELSAVLWQASGGAFDITSAPLSQCWGFLKREGRMPNDREVAQAMESVGMDKLELNPTNRTVRFLHPDLTLNLGGIGKGWTLDRISEALWKRDVHDFIFHAGQSSVLAVGCQIRANHPPNARQESTATDHGWEVGVSHPLFPDRQLGRIDLRDRALGTSGSARQFIHYRGERLSHILDPRTGRPATGVLSVTVLAPTAAQADALGTACFVLGVEGSSELVKAFPDVAVLLVLPGPRGGRVETLGNWDGIWHAVRN